MKRIFAAAILALLAVTAPTAPARAVMVGPSSNYDYDVDLNFNGNLLAGDVQILPPDRPMSGGLWGIETTLTYNGVPTVGCCVTEGTIGSPGNPWTDTGLFIPITDVVGFYVDVGNIPRTLTVRPPPVIP